MSQFDFDVIVVGAGPAGSTFVTALENSGLKIALIDKSTFPRDKVCGDAIPGRAGKVLKSISARYFSELQKFDQKTTIWRARAVGSDWSQCDIHFTKNGYAATRMEFDNLLYGFASNNKNCQFFQGQAVKNVQSGNQRVNVTFADGQGITAKLIIGCDGAHSVVSKSLTNTSVDKKHHCGAVRGYYQNVKGLEDDLLEFYLLDKFLPGYFWIFPLPNNRCNVGFGMLSTEVAKRQFNLKQAIPDILSSTPLAQRFEGAELISPIQGFGLPMGSRKVPLSGCRFMLCGDAASLIEPATGEGIGSAMLSAKLAAEQTIQCFEKDDFSSEFLMDYDSSVYNQLWTELRTKYWIQKLLGNRPGWINFFIRQANTNPVVKKLIKIL